MKSLFKRWWFIAYTSRDEAGFRMLHLPGDPDAVQRGLI